jgi:imidazolonepropionase-like amidohydrolase
MYGTDFGNTTTAGIDEQELALMMEAGMDGTAILAAGTSTPASYWGFQDLGTLEVGKRASLLVLSGDPRESPLLLAEPEAVYIEGVKR